MHSVLLFPSCSVVVVEVDNTCANKIKKLNLSSLSILAPLGRQALILVGTVLDDNLWSPHRSIWICSAARADKHLQVQHDLYDFFLFFLPLLTLAIHSPKLPTLAKHAPVGLLASCRAPAQLPLGPRPSWNPNCWKWRSVPPNSKHTYIQSYTYGS